MRSDIGWEQPRAGPVGDGQTGQEGGSDENLEKYQGLEEQLMQIIKNVHDPSVLHSIWLI